MITLFVIYSDYSDVTNKYFLIVIASVGGGHPCGGRGEGRSGEKRNDFGQEERRSSGGYVHLYHHQHHCHYCHYYYHHHYHRHYHHYQNSTKITRN